MDEKKLRKSIMNTETNTVRLQTLKVKRDLSLGIAKPKKAFAPNLNVIRNKDKTKELLKKNDQKRRERNTNRERFDKTDKTRFVQSSGVFSQGSGEIKRNSTSVEYFREKREPNGGGGGSSALERPTINQTSWHVDKKVEDNILEELTNCDIDSDDDDKAAFVPLTLSSAATKSSLAIKKEEGDLLAATAPFNCDKYSDDSPAIGLVKLPDSFAGKGLSDDPSVKKLFDYPLKGMLEGQIGRLLVRKSGKMEIEIGRVRYELRPEATFESREELAVVREKSENGAQMAVLGNVLNNFVMFPDYEAMLKKK